jgi:hypothetical protein
MDKTNTSSSNLILIFIQPLNDYTSTILPSGTAICNKPWSWSRITLSMTVCLGVEPTLELVTRYYFLLEGWCLKVAVLFLWGTLSDKRVCSAITQWSKSRRTCNRTLLSHLRLPQPRPGSRIYIPQEQISYIRPDFNHINKHCLVMDCCIVEVLTSIT